MRYLTVHLDKTSYQEKIKTRADQLGTTEKAVNKFLKKAGLQDFLYEGLARKLILEFAHFLEINEAQRVINELSVGAVATDVDEHTKIAKEKGNLLKVKESGIRLKLEVAKLQSDILKNRGNVDATINDRSGGSASTNDFKAIREMIKNNANPISEDENE